MNARGLILRGPRDKRGQKLALHRVLLKPPLIGGRRRVGVLQHMRQQ